MPIEPYDGYYRRSELEAMKAEAARVERERCNAKIERLRAALKPMLAHFMAGGGGTPIGKMIEDARRVLDGDGQNDG